jgi:hypothetical protein
MATCALASATWARDLRAIFGIVDLIQDLTCLHRFHYATATRRA